MISFWKLIKKNKRGLLLASETLKIILAVISISFLIFLLTSIYFSSVHSKKLEKATASMQRISEVIQHVDVGKIASENVTTLTPAGWYFFSFTGREIKPNSCAETNCLCICDKILEVKMLGRTQIKECANKGVCSIVPKLEEFNKFEIGSAGNPTSIGIKKEGVWIKVSKI